MFEVDVKNVTKGRMEGEKEEDQIGFGILIKTQTKNHKLFVLVSFLDLFRYKSVTN